MNWRGFAGQILHVDLTAHKTRAFPLPEEWVPKFLGGYGINNRLFWDYQVPGTDPFAPENTIVLGCGPLVGTLMPGAGKVIGTTKSPVVATPGGLHFIDNAVGGSRRFGLMLKNAGYDHLVITGKSEKPVYLRITDREIRIEPAADLWGAKDIYETTDLLLRKNPLAGILAIGKAGENLVRYALAMLDFSGHLGKFGFGAVMGSKHLKAIVTYGSRGIKVADAPGLLKIIQEIRNRLMKSPLLKLFQDIGISSGWDLQAPLVYEGNIPYRLWKKKFGPDVWQQHKFQHNLACTGCVLACRTAYQIREGPFKGVTSFTGHHLLPARIALRLGLEDPAQAIKLLDVCNRAGVDFFTFGGILNWLTRVAPNNFNRDFVSYLHLCEQTISKTGIGKNIAEGWYPLGEFLGKNPEDFIGSTGLFKGSDAIQDGRTTTLDPQRFTYITNPRPHHGGNQGIYTLPKMTLEIQKEDASHLGLSPEEFSRVFMPAPYYGQFNVARYAKHAEDAMAVHNCLGTCVMYALLGTDVIHIEKLAALYSATTGIPLTPQELKHGGERVFTLYKLLNIREGWTFRDKISHIWLTPRETPDGLKILKDYYQKREITEVEVEKLLNDYYEERGWHSNGIPSDEKLQELGLVDFAYQPEVRITNT